MKFSAKTNNAIKMALLFMFIFVCMSVFVFVQPFGDGPDEISGEILSETVIDK